MRKASVKSYLLTALALIASTVPVMAAVLCYFPLWRERGGGAVVSGVTLLLLIPSLIPLFRYLKEKLRSPSARTLWLVCFIAFLALSKIADEMVVISFIGFVSNLLGSILFALAKKIKENEK